MALATTAKINIIGHQKNQDKILEVLQNLGFSQIEDCQEKDLIKNNINEALSDLEYKIAGVRFCLEFLAGYETEKKSLKEKIDSKINLPLGKIEKIVNEFDYTGKTKEIQEIESNINEARNIIDKSALELVQIEPWQNLNFVPNRQKLESGFDYKFLIINKEVRDQLLFDLQKNLPLSDIETVKESNKEIFAVLFFKKSQEANINEILNEINIKSIEIPDLEVSVFERIKQINKKISESEIRIEKLIREAQRLANSQYELKVTFDFLSWQKEKLIQKQKTGNTSKAFSLIGWIDKESIKILEKELNKITADFTIDELSSEGEENIPVIFKNTWASPFEFVTGVYGSPQYHEPDPTPWLTPFFVLFFGLCMTDAGYGIVLALFSWLAMKILKPSKEAAKMFKVIMIGGIATFFAGALVGGWFGIIIDDIKIDWLRNLLVNIRLIDPVKEPIKMLIFALILGIIQVIVGILVSLWWKIKHKNFISAILDDCMWLYFILAILIGGASKFGLIDFSYSKYLVWVGVIGLVATQGRSQKNPILKLTSGVISLYGLVGYLSDVLSYSRLLALGLATGIIAMVINLIAKLTIDMVPYLGWVIAFFIIIGGHIFNIGINALGAFIHSSRLQFVEFFPKFMEGGGMDFVPFKKESKYVRIVNNK